MRILIVFLIEMLVCSASLHVATSQFKESVDNEKRDLQYETTDETAVVYIDPANMTVRSADVFLISVKVDNVIGLYGLDVKLSWDPSIITYINHTVYIPVEDYPNGIMHKPIQMIRNVVSETGIPGTPSGTLCWIAYSQIGKTPGFNGSGTILSLAFQAMKIGSCPINFVSVDLGGSGGLFIPKIPVDGLVEVSPFDHDLCVHLETPLHVLPNDTIRLNATVFNTGLNEEFSVDLNLLIDNLLVNTSVTTSLPVNSSVTLFYVWTPFVEKTYNLTLETSPVLGETYLQNNWISKNVLVSMVIRVPADSPTLRNAIHIASPGTTIQVASGVYYEQPVIRKSLQIIGESGSVLDGQGNDIVIQIDADHVTLDGIIIRNGYRRGIFVNYGAHVTIVRCHIDDVMDHGILLNDADYAKIMYNIIKNCMTALGIHDLPQSVDNLIVGNTFINNYEAGFILKGSGHIIYHNNFIDTGVYSGGLATWDNGEGEGNYWSDYSGRDIDGDGVGDTLLPHRGVDNFPLMEPWTSGLIGDVTLDFKVDIFDLVSICLIYGCTEESIGWNPFADLAPIWGLIDIFDLVTCAYHYGEELL